MKKKPKSFIGFLIVSTFFWFLMNLSATYVQVLPLEVEYIDLPQNKVYNSEPLKIINVEVKATGFNLLLANFSQKKIKLSLKSLIKNDKVRYFILLQNITMSIKKQLSSGLGFTRVLQDVIYFDLATIKTKKVPVIPDLSVDYGLGFGASSIIIKPDSLSISGADELLASVKTISLEQLALKDVKDKIIRSVKVVSLKNDKIKLSHQKVTIQINVDKFTEGEIEVPVTLINSTFNNITIFPKKVKVIYRVALKNFNKITSNAFNLEADYRYTVDNKLTYLVPKLTFKSKLVSGVRIEPERIDFLVNK